MRTANQKNRNYASYARKIGATEYTITVYSTTSKKAYLEYQKANGFEVENNRVWIY
jgi:hypothetical protein